MTLLVLRLLAVYCGTVALALFLAHRYVRSLRPAAILFCSLAPLLFTGRALLTAGVYAPLDIVYNAEPLRSYRAEGGVGEVRQAVLGDVVYQMIPWQKAIREAVENGRLPLWNRFVLGGEPLLAVQQHGVLHPTTWIGFLLPLAQAWTFGMTFRLFLALLGAYLLLRELECGEIASMVAAAAWAFGDTLFFFLGYGLQAATAPLPLLLLGLRRLAQAPSRRSLALTLVPLLLMMVAGHPESVLHVVAGAGVFFLFELARAGRGRRAKPLGLALVAGGLTLGLCAVLFLPFREAAQSTFEYGFRRGWYAKADRSLPLTGALERSLKNLVPYAPKVWEPAGIRGLAPLPARLRRAAGPARERWPLVIAGAVGLAAFGRFPVVNDWLCRLPLFDITLNERMVFLWGWRSQSWRGSGSRSWPRGAAASSRVLAAGTTAAVLVWRTF